MTVSELREALGESLAGVCHALWAEWMGYEDTKYIRNPDGSVTIPGAFLQRWTRQANTAYNDLPENEKRSDREMAEKYIWPVILPYFTA